MNKNKLFLPKDCIRARFVRRIKRFTILASKDGQDIWAHTNNSGSMLGLLKPGRTLLLSPAKNPKRKLPYTLELIYMGHFWVGVNTSVPNKMLKIIWENKLIPEWAVYERFIPEARLNQSRLDAKLEGRGGVLWVEAKNVTLVEDDVAYFPDAQSERARKHLRELIGLAKKGHQVACFYLIQRPDCNCFGPADFIDPEFAKLFWQAIKAGVKMYPFQAVVDEQGIALGKRLSLVENGAIY
ncbi:DNA/RNA nuclease SfsA [Desulfohalobiaceae bacterium Ax17]|uniref:DNA/RNA nuclease SfsA n=1 Tax=Desulfovulcanus ferrireducens TaxID=2831190 RepID=UPI00207BC921|nr:DNA/RNA nuclease SfsA [Desulfovulcanus ferrireducens]MBT8763513.1 DNA/RNA nuclease SfsA [Desulfovulcanus ferrireducens]